MSERPIYEIATVDGQPVEVVFGSSFSYIIGADWVAHFQWSCDCGYTTGDQPTQFRCNLRAARHAKKCRP